MYIDIMSWWVTKYLGFMRFIKQTTGRCAHCLSLYNIAICLAMLPQDYRIFGHVCYHCFHFLMLFCPLILLLAFFSVLIALIISHNNPQWRKKADSPHFLGFHISFLGIWGFRDCWHHVISHHPCPEARRAGGRDAILQADIAGVSAGCLSSAGVFFEIA